jgi:hypothetical protein
MNNTKPTGIEVEAWTDAELRKVLRVFLELVIENKELKTEIAKLREAGNPASVETVIPVSEKCKCASNPLCPCSGISL